MQESTLSNALALSNIQLNIVSLMSQECLLIIGDDPLNNPECFIGDILLSLGLMFCCY